MNSFRAVERALAYETDRQYAALAGDEARRWAPCRSKLAAGTTRRMTLVPQRHKEESSDYRYFPEPDLVPVLVNEAEVEKIRAALGNCRPNCATGWKLTFGITAYDSDVLVNQA